MVEYKSLTNNVNQWKLIMITLICIKNVLTPVGFNKRKDVVFSNELKRNYM